MNFLGHSMISLEIDEKIDKSKKTLYGNFAGDFYKGKIESIDLPDNLKEGLVLLTASDWQGDCSGGGMPRGSRPFLLCGSPLLQT